MIKKRFLLKQQKVVKVDLLEEWFDQLMGIDEFTWGTFEFTREMLRKKISEEEKREIIEKSIKCGKDWAQKMLYQFELKSYNQSNRSEYLAKQLGLTITERSGRPTKFRMVFAQFIMDNSIEIIEEPLAAYKKLAEESEKLPKTELVRAILIAHEIFHYLEEKYGEEMYQTTKTVPLWRFFQYEHRSTVNCASEIAAMAFAKELCSAEFVPQILDVLLSYPLEVDFSKSIYDVVIGELSTLKDAKVG